MDVISWSARGVHNPEVGSSNLPPATSSFCLCVILREGGGVFVIIVCVWLLGCEWLMGMSVLRGLLLWWLCLFSRVGGV